MTYIPHSKTLAGAVVALLLLGAASELRASLLTITNSSFEAPAVGDGGFTAYSNSSNPVPGFSLNPGNDPSTNTPESIGVYDPNGANFPGADGNQIVYINTRQNLTGSLTSSILSTPITANTLYTLTVAVGRGTAGASSMVEILVNSVSRASMTIFLTGAQQLTDISASFTSSGAENSGNIQIRLTSTAGAAFSQGSFDNVRLNATAVPEPSTFLAAGVAVLVIACRKFLAA